MSNEALELLAYLQGATLPDISTWPSHYQEAIRIAISSQCDIDIFRSEIKIQLNGRGDVILTELEAAEQQQKAQSQPKPKVVKNTKKVPGLLDYAKLTPNQEAEAASAGNWLDEYVGFASKASPLTPGSFHESAGIFIASLAIARRLHLEVSVKSNYIRPNLFMLFVGHSTLPRKSTGLRVVRGLLTEAGLLHFLMAERQTPEALSLDLTTRIPKSYYAQTIEVQEQWLKERAIAAQRSWLLEEASHLLDSFNRDYSVGLLPMVLDLYDAADIGPSRNTINRGRESVEDSYLSIFGCTTFSALGSHAQEAAHWHNGLFARFALVGSDNNATWQFWPKALDYPPDLVNKLKHIAFNLLPIPIASITQITVGTGNNAQDIDVIEVNPTLQSSKVDITQAAWDQWERYNKAITFDMLQEPSKVPARFYANYGRLGTMLIKVAIILATLDTKNLPVSIEAKHVYRAQQIVEKWRYNLHEIMAKVMEDTEKQGKEELEDNILSQLVTASPNWLGRRDLLRALNKKWSDIREVIDNLESSGLLERQPIVGKPGPASEEYKGINITTLP